MADEKKSSNDLNDMLDGAKESASSFTKGANEVLASENKKMVAGIVAILIGSLGIHKFILGYTKEGIIQLVASFVTCGISESWINRDISLYFKNIESQMNEITVIIKKIELILNNPELMN